MVVLAASCSSDSSATWCSDAGSFVDTAVAFRGFDELPANQTLRSTIHGAVESAPGVVEGADPEVRDAFESLTKAMIDVDRTLGLYGYDLLRAQSESDTAEQEDLYSLDGASIAVALAEASAHIADQCGGA